MGIDEELHFIPQKYHALYLRVQHAEDPLHELMVWTVESEASNY
jgi:hypothetical protein